MILVEKEARVIRGISRVVENALVAFFPNFLDKEDGGSGLKAIKNGIDK